MAIFCRAPVSFTTAALGGEIEIPGLDGTRHAIDIPAGIQSGKQLRKRGEGMPVLQGRGRGDLVIDAAKAAGRTLSGIEGMFMEEMRDTILKRARGIHQNTRLGMPEAVCSCGLIVPADVPLDRATGHLDDQLWEPVRTMLVSCSNDWWREGLPCRAYCQACGWLGEDAPYAEAEQARLAHTCEESR